MLQGLPYVLFSIGNGQMTLSISLGYTLIASLLFRHAKELVSKERLCDAIDVILSLQNPGGGFASYELIRGPAILEMLNPAEVFGKLISTFLKILRR